RGRAGGAGTGGGGGGCGRWGRPLAAFVRADGAAAPLVARLLRDVYLVDDLGQAITRFGAANPPATFVTRAGEVLDRSGALTGGTGAPPGALSRAGEIRRLSAERAELEPRCAALASEHTAAVARV